MNLMRSIIKGILIEDIFFFCEIKLTAPWRSRSWKFSASPFSETETMKILLSFRPPEKKIKNKDRYERENSLINLCPEI